MKQSCDVTIVGAGPAGATLAYELARRGIGVLLLEKERLPRYKCCGGAVTSKAARLLHFDISKVVDDVIHEVSFTFNLGRPYLGQHCQPLMYTVMRDAFDYLAVQKARQLGAVLMDSQKVTQVQVSKDWFEISTASNVFRCRFMVGADGAYSTVAKELGMERRVEYLVGIESEIVVPEEELSKWESRAQIELGHITGGYAWVFPKRNHLSVGVGCHASQARHLRSRHQKFLNSLGTGCYTISRSGGHLIPTCTKGSLIWQNRVLLLGDAAGLADPLTGEGIHNAILSAQLAAPVVEDCLAHDRANLKDYQEAVDQKIMSELQIARVLSRFVIQFPHLAFEMLKRSHGLWKVGCGLMSGELKYADIKERAGGFKGILKQLLRA